jgi:hypothetical protein
MNEADCICGKSADRFCAGCSMKGYCSQSCQAKDRVEHKEICDTLLQVRLERLYVSILSPDEHTYYLRLLSITQSRYNTS